MAFFRYTTRAIWFTICCLSVMVGKPATPPQHETVDVDVHPWYEYDAERKARRALSLKLPKAVAGKVSISVQVGKEEETFVFRHSEPTKHFSILLPVGVGVDSAQVAKLTIQTAEEHFEKEVNVPVKKQWTVYIYPHSHVDIGYTNLQDTVKALHVRNIDVGIDLARKTQSYPAGARFVWNPEVTWVVDSYLKNADDEKKQRFIEAVRKGWVKLDAAHSNINFSVCSDEELIRVFKNSTEIQKLTGKPIETMIFVDLPGAPWGLVQIAAQHGVKGIFSFPNFYDMRNHWENKPFYWVSPDGKNKVFFLQGISYGWGYRIKGSKYGLEKSQSFTPALDRLTTDNPAEHFLDPLIFNETAKLEKDGSPYDIFAITWSMADNCLIDADLPEAVKMWNEKYAYPKLVIAGADQIVEAYQQKYAAIIPEYRGDFTEFWTNGLGSDAKRVGQVRAAKENLVQAETLWSMLGPDHAIPADTLDNAWEQVMLAAEHTWGYQDPRAPRAKAVEAVKASYFEEAAALSEQLVNQGAAEGLVATANTFTVFNTVNWARGGMIRLPADQTTVGDIVVDGVGNTVPSQRLSTGELLVEASDVPALGSAVYRVLPGKPAQSGDLLTGNWELRNDIISVQIDTLSGDIVSLYSFAEKKEFVDTVSTFNVNSFNYLRGVYNGIAGDSLRPVTGSYDVVLDVKENGPLMASVQVNSKGAGIKGLSREVRIYKGKNFVELYNVLDKTPDRRKEGIHFGFSFLVPGGKIKMDVPWAVMTPEKDQLPYANKNWFTFQRWIDVSNERHGITWTALQAPLVQFGGLTGHILDGARQERTWIKRVPETQTIVSWPVNNHWDTNFPLAQSGKIPLKYVIMPHGRYDQSASNRFGMEQHRPLIVVQGLGKNMATPLVTIDNENVVISIIKRHAQGDLILRIRSVSNQDEEVNLSWPQRAPKGIYLARPNGEKLEEVGGKLVVPAYASITLRVVGV